MMREVAYSLLGGLSRAWMRVGGPGTRGVRVLAYHDVGDPERFEAQIRSVSESFTPVTGEDLIDCLEGAGPRRPVWVTFDDGDPTIVESGLEVLERHGVKATAFVCPGLIDTFEPFWWEIVEMAVVSGVRIEGKRIGEPEISRMKTIGDAQRRELVDELRRKLQQEHSLTLRRRQLTTAELERWINAGNDLGNHTWDHPMLDTCDPSEQRGQIQRAHDWLTSRFGRPRWFAYPNGNHHPQAESLLIELGYDVGVLFDHRVHRDTPRIRTSRIRVNGSDALPEFQAKLYGLHPALHHLIGRS